MTAHLYDPEFTAAFFDDYGDREWTRLVNTPADEIKLHLHSHYLTQHIQAGSLVLDVGAGAGRFTQILVELGAKVIVADLSSRQLELNKQYAEQLNFAHGINEWLSLDVCEMSALRDEQFDAVVCYGNPLGYVFERRDQALNEILRVLKRRGKAFISVSSLWGSIHELLPAVLGVDADKNKEIIQTGDLYFDSSEGMRHRCHLFRGEEFSEFLNRNCASIVSLSASNSVSTVWGDNLQLIRSNPERWSELLEIELEACRQPGCLEMGTHLIAVIEKRL